MALIYAFRDEAGQWHGDPDGTRHEVNRPAQMTLAFRPEPGEPGAGSPFAGQVLQVLVAGVDEAQPGDIMYRLDNGKRHYALLEVDLLLFGDDIGAASPNTADLRRVSWLLSLGGAGFGGFHDGDAVVGRCGVSVVGSFEFPVRHFAFDHAWVAAWAAAGEVAQDFTDGSAQCPGQS